MIASTQPLLKKASLVVGKTLIFRNATLNDAEFILSLRIDTQKSRYLNKVSGELTDQKSWLQRYAMANDQAYFIIELNGDPIGTVRLYDPQGDSFCWGSWILKDGIPNHVAIESALMVYAYALDHLGFREAHFDIRKGNERVWQFHERFGAHRITETELDYHYKIGFDAITTSRRRYRKFLNESVSPKFHF